MANLRIKYVEPDALTPAPYNPRKIRDEEREALRRGIEAFGFVDPIIAREEDGLVLGGHQRLDVAKALGLAKVPVVYVPGLDDDRAAALNVLLNNPKAQGAWDMAKLTDLLSELDAHGFDATLTGFSEPDLEDFATWTPSADEDEDDDDGGRPDRDDRGAGTIQFNVVFDDEDQHSAFLDLVRLLNRRYPELPSIGSRFAHLAEILKIQADEA